MPWSRADSRRTLPLYACSAPMKDTPHRDMERARELRAAARTRTEIRQQDLAELKAMVEQAARLVKDARGALATRSHSGKVGSRSVNGPVKRKR
jgi:hypothetical protein